MVVVVADPPFEERWRSRGLNPADQAGVDEDAKGVVDTLKRNGPHLGPDTFSDRICGDVGVCRHHPQHCQALGRHAQAAVVQQIGGAGGHVPTLVKVEALKE